MRVLAIYRANPFAKYVGANRPGAAPAAARGAPTEGTASLATTAARAKSLNPAACAASPARPRASWTVSTMICRPLEIRNHSTVSGFRRRGCVLHCSHVLGGPGTMFLGCSLSATSGVWLTQQPYRTAPSLCDSSATLVRLFVCNFLFALHCPEVQRRLKAPKCRYLVWF